MLDLGWSELLVIGSLALIVVGPKDLPSLLRTVGKHVGQMRGMARDFQRSMEDAAREADISKMKELRDTANELRSLTRAPFQTVTPSPARPARTSASAAAATAGAAGAAAPVETAAVETAQVEKAAVPAPGAAAAAQPAAQTTGEAAGQTTQQPGDGQA
jgi:sec-independent protein translocase protein TatB